MTQEEREVAIKYNEFAKVLSECSKRISEFETEDALMMGLRVAAASGLMAIASIVTRAVGKRSGFKSS